MRDVPLVLIHGYPFDHTMWFGAIAALGTRIRSVVPDLPGFGNAPVPRDAAPSMERYADFIAGILTERGFEKAIVAGMSMGGYVALAFAEKYPERLAGIGLVSSQAAADSPEAKQARFDTIQKIRANGVSVVTDALVPKMFSSKADEELKKFPAAGAEKAGMEGLCWALEAMANRPDRTDVLRNLECPVVILHGTEDQIVPVAKARALAEDCGRSILIEIPEAGHGTPLEAPDAVATGLTRLLEDCRAAAEQRDSAGGKPA